MCLFLLKNKYVTYFHYVFLNVKQKKTIEIYILFIDIINVFLWD